MNIPNGMSRDLLKGKSIETESEREKEKDMRLVVAWGWPVTTNGPKGSAWDDGKSYTCTGTTVP